MVKKIKHLVIFFLIGSLSVLLFGACGIKATNTSLETNKASPAAECQIIQHAAGETCSPSSPKKLITLSFPALTNAMILGIQPIGSTNFNVEEFVFPRYLEDKAQGVEPLGGNAQPSIEKITLLKPDLIFGWYMNNSGAYPLLSKIAPTLLFDWQGTPSWREYFDFMAKALGKEEAAQKAWDDYYQRVEQLKQALGDRYEDKKISFLYFCCDGFGSQAQNSFSGSILEDIGLQRPESQAVNAKYGEISFSHEDIDKVDGDVLFVASYFEQDRAYFEQIKQKALWKQLKVVRQNRFYIVDAETWRGGNLMAANAVLDDLEKYLVKK